MGSRPACVAVLLLGAFLLACAEEPTSKASLAAVDATVDAAYKKHGEGKHYLKGMDGKDGKDGKDGAPGADGRTGPAGPQGKPGKDGVDGKDGRDALVTIAWRSGSTKKVNITAGERVKHVMNQLSSVAKCEKGEKAVACSCDTGMSSSAGVGFIPPKATDYAQQDGSWIGRLNYITLVENALSGPQDKDFKDTCKCTGLYVATVRARANRARRIDRDEDDDNEEHEHEDEDEDEEYAMAHIQATTMGNGAPSNYGSQPDWTTTCPKWQAFEVTATATCQGVKLVPQPHYKDVKYEDTDYTKSGSDKEDEEEETDSNDKKADDKKYSGWNDAEWEPESKSDKY